MKQLFTILFFLAVAGGINRLEAQITVGPEKLPVAGDVHLTIPMDTSGVNEGTAGGNKMWNFSSLQSSGPSLTINFVNAAGTPYAQNFPDATLASVVDDGGFVTYGYFSTASNKLTSYGSAGEEFLISYSDPEVQMATPLIYNDTFSDQFRGVMTGDGFSVRTSGSITIVNDSYGMITLPDGRTMPAARLKFARENFDTTFVAGIPIMTSSMKVTSYEWFVSTAKFPVVQIAYFVQNTNGSVTSFKKVEYNPNSPTSVDEPGQENVASSFVLNQNFPNPFNPTTTISFKLANAGRVSLTVYNMIGEVVATLINEELAGGIYAVPFDAHGLASGTYLYRLQVGEKVQTRKLMLLR